MSNRFRILHEWEADGHRFRLVDRGYPVPVPQWHAGSHWDTCAFADNHALEEMVRLASRVRELDAETERRWQRPEMEPSEAEGTR